MHIEDYRSIFGTTSVHYSTLSARPTVSSREFHAWLLSISRHVSWEVEDGNVRLMVHSYDPVFSAVLCSVVATTANCYTISSRCPVRLMRVAPHQKRAWCCLNGDRLQYRSRCPPALLRPNRNTAMALHIRRTHGDMCYVLGVYSTSFEHSSTCVLCSDSCSLTGGVPLRSVLLEADSLVSIHILIW